LIFVFNRATTKKVIAIGKSLDDLGFDNPKKSRIPQSDAKPKNELDNLSDSINSMLDVISSDIEKREQREQDFFASQKKLTYRANHDLLSGLVNRRGFEKYLKLAIVSSQNDQTGHVFCYLDLDQFMIIIDTCGHIVSDELLRQVSHLLKKIYP
jgi:predicted signal transduction protein with EAL and GGDEF domain